ncbi:hypothetical protein [Roseovarius sp. TE539]|uniref:hypothetical protein n=1 Tax=Roseovarius sp. TE539 TaxID=2249812 RepID=UPI00215CFFBD|nr:hypothetical protein [Roseovarius sp. TE539]
MKPRKRTASTMGRVRHARRRLQVWARRHLPPGARLIVGLLFIAGGVLAFLPVLGVWMIPVGLAIAALDVVPVWKRLRGDRKDRRRGS